MAGPAPHRVRAAFRDAVVAMGAALATLACTLALAPAPGSAVLAVVLSLSMARSRLADDRRHRRESAIVLPLVGLAAVGVGMLLRDAPWLGAALFVAGMALPIWMRRFGQDARRIGSLLALPFVALLVAPHGAAVRAGPFPAWLFPVVIALLAALWASVAHALAVRAGWLETAPPVAAPSPAHASPPAHADARAPRLKPGAATRMALQMAVALAVSFAVGHAFFAGHWAWLVLTAYIVASGNRGRLDVAWKSLLRIAGAGAGTAVALLLDVHAGGHGAAVAALILAAVFLGVWLRPLGYGWWALFVTIALALLQGFSDAPAAQLLAQRMLEIVAGAAIAVACAWWLLPVRSTGVLRRRMADALAALSAALDPANPERSPAAFAAALDELARVAPAFRALRAATARWRQPQTADWIDALCGCRAGAVALIESGTTPPEARRAVGAARKALLEPATLLPALRALRGALRDTGAGAAEAATLIPAANRPGSAPASTSPPTA
ncbi:MAG: FUSC family protein [Luteimonas sp.]